MGIFHPKKKKKGHRNQRERETDRVPSCKNSHPRLNKQGCKWENDDTIQLHKFIIKKKKKKRNIIMRETTMIARSKVLHQPDNLIIL